MGEQTPSAAGSGGARVDFTCNLESVGGVPVLTVAGEIELRHRADFRTGLQKLIEHDGPLVLVDLAGVSFFDSAGLHELDWAYHTAHNQGTRIALVAPRKNVVRLFEITGLTSRYPIFATTERAVSSVGP